MHGRARPSDPPRRAYPGLNAVDHDVWRAKGRRWCGMSPRGGRGVLERATRHGSRTQYGTGGSQRRRGVGVTSGSQIATSCHQPRPTGTGRYSVVQPHQSGHGGSDPATSHAAGDLPSGTAPVRPRGHRSSRRGSGGAGQQRRARWAGHAGASRPRDDKEAQRAPYGPGHAAPLTVAPAALVGGPPAFTEPPIPDHGHRLPPRA